MNTESRIERDRVLSQTTFRFETAQVPIAQVGVRNVNGPTQNAKAEFTDGSETPSNAAILQLTTAKVSPAQVEKRSVEEINRERAEKFLAGGSVSSPVRNTYRPSSSGFTYLKGNCPVCSGARRDCRQSNASGLIFCRGQATNSSWGFIKEDSNGFGIYKNGLEGDRSYTYQPTIPKPVKNRLSDPERHRQFKQIAKYSGLSTQHRAKLEHRGLNATTIDTFYTSSLVWTWANNEQIPVTTSELPGINPRSGRLREEFRGMAIAIPSITGHILGAQIKPDNGDGYFWVSSDSIGGNGPRLSNDELPIGVYGHHQKTINFCEGYLKSAIAAEWHELFSVGSAGGGWANSPEQLKAIIETTGANNFILNPDGGMLDEKHKTVITAYSRLNELLQSWGYTLQVRWWGQSTKTDGDIDEISSETYKGAQLISWDEFIGKLEYQYEYQKQTAPDEQLSRTEQRRRRAAENWVPLLSSQGDDKRQFFGDALADTINTTKLGDRKLIAQAGPPGKGKSVSLQKASKIAQRKGYERLGFSHLETASRGMAIDMGIAYRKSNDNGSTEFVSCIAALIPDASGADWTKLAAMDGPRMTAIDEASESAQGLSGYRYNARTKRRNAEQIMGETNIGVIQSATLKPYDVEFFRNMGGFKPDEVIIDAISTAPYPRDIYIHPPTPPQGVNNKLVAIHKVLELSRTARDNSIGIILTSDSQKPTSNWGTSVIEYHLQTHVGDCVDLTRMDSQTTKDTDHPAYYLAQEKDIYVGAGEVYIPSPSVELNTSFKPKPGVTLISLNLDTGSMDVERLLQADRIRGSHQQHIFLSEHKSKLPHRGALTPEEVLADIEDKEANHTVQLVQNVLSGEPLDKQSYVLQDYCKRVADHNCSLLGKSIILPQVLAQQGHNITIVPQSDYEAIAEELEQLRADLDRSRQQTSETYYQNVSSAQRRSKEWVEQTEKSGQYSEAEYYEIRRYKTELLLGNHLNHKVIDGAVEECDEGIKLTPPLVEAHEKRRLTTAWRRSFDLNQSIFDWLLADASRLDGNVPSLIESSESKTAKNLALEQSGIAQFVRNYAIWQIDVHQDYDRILDASKPSEAFQRQIIQSNIDKAFSRDNPELKAIAQRLNPPGELEKLTSVLGVEVQRDKQGNVTVGNIQTIIRQYYGTATFKSNAVRADGQTGATIICFDDRADAIYRLTLKADKLERINLTRDEIMSRINHEKKGVYREQMFSVWEESRKVWGVMGLEDVSLFDRELKSYLTNSDTNLDISLPAWVSQLGINPDNNKPAFKIGQRVTRTDADGWGGFIKVIKDGICDVLFDLESATKAIAFEKLALV